MNVPPVYLELCDVHSKINGVIHLIFYIITKTPPDLGVSPIMVQDELAITSTSLLADLNTLPSTCLKKKIKRQMHVI